MEKPPLKFFWCLSTFSSFWLCEAAFSLAFGLCFVAGCVFGQTEGGWGVAFPSASPEGLGWNMDTAISAAIWFSLADIIQPFINNSNSPNRSRSAPTRTDESVEKEGDHFIVVQHVSVIRWKIIIKSAQWRRGDPEDPWRHKMRKKTSWQIIHVPSYSI